MVLCCVGLSGLRNRVTVMELVPDGGDESVCGLT